MSAPMNTAPRILTFGCRLNAYESEVMRGHAEAAAAFARAYRCQTAAAEPPPDRELLHYSGVAWIMADRPEGGIVVDDCARISTAVSAVLDVEDPIPGHYNLEVSSPGLDRPLKKPADFERFAGQKIKLKTLRMLDPDKRGKSRKTFTGELLGLSGDMIRIELDDKTGGQAMIALADLEKVNLVEEF